MFLHREKELAELLRVLTRGKHALIIGEKGVGKTRLMQEAMNCLQGSSKMLGLIGRKNGLLHWNSGELRKRCNLFMLHVSPLSVLLKEMARELHERRLLRIQGAVPEGEWSEAKKSLTGMGIVAFQECIVESLKEVSPPACIFLDSLDRLTTTSQEFLEALLGVAVVCAGVVQPKTAFQFKKIWASFTRIPLDPFGRSETRRLVEELLRRHSVKVLDVDLFVNQILKSAGGNPFQVRNLLWQTSRDRHVGLRDIRTLGKTEAGEYFNMGPLYIMLASVLTLSRIFSFGTDNREFYIYFSALGFVVYLLFRVFRTFFLFKPQRRV